MRTHQGSRHLVAAWIFLLTSLTLHPTKGSLPPHNPAWPPTYEMTSSLITMQVNSSGGLSSPTRGAEFGIVSYDWSNAKASWAKSKPMDCQEWLDTQARATKAAINNNNNNNNNNRTSSRHVFVYRNLVKALPWFRTVREKLQDPAYAGFFLTFDPQRQVSNDNNNYHVPACAAENATKCSHKYHDQLQTPQVPTATNPHPDGACDGYCDCGENLPCGEYLFDHRNGTMLREFIVDEIIVGAIGLDGSTVVDGVFMDDYWCSNLLCQQDPSIAGCPCNDPVQGPTEIDAHAQEDMGLSDEDIRDLTLAWNDTMTAVEQALLNHGAYTWSLMLGQHNANAQPFLLKPEQCVQALRDACQPSSTWQTHTRLFGFTVVNGTKLAHLHQDLAFFLLARGPYSYAGWGVWGMTWPFNAEPAHGGLPPMPHGVPLPEEFYNDYGVPNGICHELEGQGIFQRQWSRSRITLDCQTFQATIETEALDETGGDATHSAIYRTAS